MTDADGVRTDAPGWRCRRCSVLMPTEIPGPHHPCSWADRYPSGQETLFWFNVRAFPEAGRHRHVLQRQPCRASETYRPKAIIRSSNDQPERKLTAERNATPDPQKPDDAVLHHCGVAGRDRSHRLSGFREDGAALGELPPLKVVAGRNPTCWWGILMITVDCR